MSLIGQRRPSRAPGFEYAPAARRAHWKPFPSPWIHPDEFCNARPRHGENDAVSNEARRWCACRHCSSVVASLARIRCVSADGRSRGVRISMHVPGGRGVLVDCRNPRGGRRMDRRSFDDEASSPTRIGMICPPARQVSAIGSPSRRAVGGWPARFPLAPWDRLMPGFSVKTTRFSGPSDTLSVSRPPWMARDAQCEGGPVSRSGIDRRRRPGADGHQRLVSGIVAGTMKAANLASSIPLPETTAASNRGMTLSRL